MIRPGPGLGLGAFSLAPTAATIGRVDAYAVLVRLEEGHWRIDPGPFALAPPSNPRSLGPWLASFDAGRLWLDGVRTTTAAVRHAPIGHHVLVAYARRDGDEGAVAWSLPLRKPPPGSPGARLTRLVAAANAGDVPMMWRLRSRETRERLGPTLPAFRAHAAPSLESRLARFAIPQTRVVTGERVSGRWAVAAVFVHGPRGRAFAFGAALHEESGTWRIELPNARGLPTEAEASDEQLRRAEQLVIWVDGERYERPHRIDRFLSDAPHVFVLFMRNGARAMGWALALKISED